MGMTKDTIPFLASVLNKDENFDIALPIDLFVLTWNYDFQMEFAASNFFQETSLEKIQLMLNQFPTPDFSAEFTKNTNKNDFSLIKLNGTAGGFDTKNGEFVAMPFSLSSINNIELEDAVHTVGAKDLSESNWQSQAVIYYHHFTRNYSEATPSIIYSWEDTPYSRKMKVKATDISRQTEILVVIGYSFPTFNRQMDKILLSSMTKLKEIYVQAPENDISAISDRLQALVGITRLEGDGRKKVNITLIPMVSKELDDEFYIPFQFKNV